MWALILVVSSAKSDEPSPVQSPCALSHIDWKALFSTSLICAASLTRAAPAPMMLGILQRNSGMAIAAGMNVGHRPAQVSSDPAHVKMMLTSSMPAVTPGATELPSAPRNAEPKPSGVLPLPSNPEMLRFSPRSYYAAVWFGRVAISV